MPREGARNKAMIGSQRQGRGCKKAGGCKGRPAGRSIHTVQDAWRGLSQQRRLWGQCYNTCWPSVRLNAGDSLGARGDTPVTAGKASFGTPPPANAPSCCLTTAMLPPLPFAAALPPPLPGPACATMGSSDTTCTARPAGRACPRADLSPRRSRRSRMGTSASEPAQTRKNTFPAEYMSETDCMVAKLWPACGEEGGGGGGAGKRVGWTCRPNCRDASERN